MFPPEQTTLNTHPFVEKIMNLQISILGKVSIEDLGEDSIYEYVYASEAFTPKEKFIIKLSALLQETHFKIDKMQMSYFLIDLYPYDEDLSPPLIEGEYLEYHMEAHLTHFMGVRDRVFATVHFLYDLKNNSKIISKTSLVKGLQEQNMIDLIQKFDDQFFHIRNVRNSVVHEYRFDSRELRDVITRDLVLRSHISDGETGLVHDLDDLKEEYEKIVQHLKSAMVRDNKMFDNIYVKFLDAYASQYTDRLKSL